MPSSSQPQYGGQALVEGVLIRSADRWAVALRRPDGSLHAYDGQLASPRGVWRLPFLRGLRLLAVQLRLGTRALMDSSMLADRGEIRPLPILATLSVVVASVLIGLFVFSAIPLLVTGRDPAVEPTLAMRLSEGLVKTSLLAIYVIGVTSMPRYRRIFSYHGAEHMAIACAEAGEPLTAVNAARHNPAHPRCGTGFLVILAGVDTFVLALLPRLGAVPDLALRIGFVPVSAAIAYELLRWGARRRGLGFALNHFGLFSQRLTTSRPDAQQLEVAIAALELCRATAPARGVAEPAVEGETAPAVPA